MTSTWGRASWAKALRWAGHSKLKELKESHLAGTKRKGERRKVRLQRQEMARSHKVRVSLRGSSLKVLNSQMCVDHG